MDYFCYIQFNIVAIADFHFIANKFLQCLFAIFIGIVVVNTEYIIIHTSYIAFKVHDGVNNRVWLEVIRLRADGKPIVASSYFVWFLFVGEPYFVALTQTSHISNIAKGYIMYFILHLLS